jgi:hypothetical protein
MFLVGVVSLIAAATVFDAVWRLLHGDLLGLITLPLALLFWYWIGVGAWRRAVFRTQLPISHRIDLDHDPMGERRRQPPTRALALRGAGSAP